MKVQKNLFEKRNINNKFEIEKKNAFKMTFKLDSLDVINRYKQILVLTKSKNIIILFDCYTFKC